MCSGLNPGSTALDPGELRYDERGLVPAIAQQHDTGEVLMQAWMSVETLQETLATGRVVYWSRRRGRWPKGATSGHVQRLVAARADCDLDSVLLLVDQTGPACHTGRPTCFFQSLQAGHAGQSGRPDWEET